MGAEEFMDLLMSSAFSSKEEKAKQLPKIKDCFERGMQDMPSEISLSMKTTSFEELWNAAEQGRLSEKIIRTVARKGVLSAWLDICPDEVKIEDHESDDE